MMLLERMSSLHQLPSPKAACWCFVGMLHLVQAPIHTSVPGAHHPEDRRRGKPRGCICGEAMVPSVPGAARGVHPKT